MRDELTIGPVTFEWDEGVFDPEFPSLGVEVQVKPGKAHICPRLTPAEAEQLAFALLDQAATARKNRAWAADAA